MKSLLESLMKFVLETIEQKAYIFLGIESKVPVNCIHDIKYDFIGKT